MPVQPAKSFGEIQNTFTFKLSRLSVINEQFTIVEDMPRNKRPRTALREYKVKKPGGAGCYQVILIRISNNGFEADLEMLEGEQSILSTALPKDIENFKGSTLAFDGRHWVYVCGTMPDVGYPSQPQATPQSIDPKDANLKKLVDMIKASELMEMATSGAIVIKMAEKISPGNALELIAYAKGKGAVYEKDGNYKAVE